MATTDEIVIGSAGVQGELWGARARDFTTVEPRMVALYEAALAELDIADGTRVLDVGCGPGLFLQLAAQAGARVSGIDAAEPFVAIARERLPHADLVTGEMETLPYDDDAFDVVTGFNAFQFAADPGNALREAGRVARPGAPILIATWGRPEQCEAAAYVKAVGALLPPPPPGAPGPFALSAPGALEAFAERGGLHAGERHEVLCVWGFPDEETLLRGLMSTGFAVKAIGAAGEEAVAAAILEAVAPYRTADGGFRLENVFTYVVARAAQRAEHRAFGAPDEVREFPNGRAEIVNIGGGHVGRFVFEPGWRWSSDVKPIAGTESCEAPHFQFHVSGRLGILMDDGTEFIAEPGDLAVLPSGHDAWVVGDEPAVVVDWHGATSYGKGG